MDKLSELRNLLQIRNENEQHITRIIKRSAQLGHIGEFIAKHIFDICLEESKSHKGSDGRFRSGPLAGKSVNVKMYSKREGLLDIHPTHPPDYYLVLAGPKSHTQTSQGQTRPWRIVEVFLFEAAPLIGRLHGRGVKVGVATSVRIAEWEAARIYPVSDSTPLRLTPQQESQLQLFRLSD